MKKLVLAYSGGLDTSYCAKYLTDSGYEVYAVCVNTGGFDAEELIEMEKRALQLGVKEFQAISAMEKYYDYVIRYLIFGNVLKNNSYPLSVSAERIIQAMEIADYANTINAKYIAHGSTGAGNDQVRFDMIFQSMAPEMTIITPIREKRLSRQEEIAYLNDNGIDIEWNKAKYSINAGLWGTSVGGDETLTSDKPLPEEAYPSQLKRTDSQILKLTFEKGECVAIDGQFDSPVQNIELIQKYASKFAIGRDIHVGDTILGIKGRVGFEAAAAIVLIKAHHLLEKHTLTKWQLQHKDSMAQWYGMHLHEGLYLDPVMRNMEAFFEDSQDHVSGTVQVTLKPYHFTVDGVESEHDLMRSDFGTYGEYNKAWTAEDAKGFIKIYSNQSKIYQQLNKESYD
ncbi:MAG: argininosuccinate synthase [Bacteroidia bacterium]|nr:argininosuccinate synthase [Bacteroidia bacterium]MBT8269153.1 argininosuccinate synthase [Bacteroidia bacterium]NNK69289.1 argininosuccinate synthase [Flavobacteriaceae bacterium]NNL80618.1 argininosuccinate synthase [Flavobacteriaceae bacterium]